MARKGLEGFPERCKVLWLFFLLPRSRDCPWRDTCPPHRGHPHVGLPRCENELGELGTAAGGLLLTGSSAGPASVFCLHKPPLRVGG